MKHHLLYAIALISPFYLWAQAPEIEWQNTIGGNLDDVLYSVHQTSDGGYILGGYSNSTNTGDKIEIGNGDDDYWVIKLDVSGNIQWQNTIGGSGPDGLLSVEKTIDGGYILGGYSGSGISGDKTESYIGSYDYWVIKLDSLGNIQWQNTIGGSGTEYLYMEQTTDFGFIVAGSSQSNISGDKTENCYGGRDYWVVKLDAIGNVIWDKTLGGSLNDGLYRVVVDQTFDGGFIIGGTSLSNISGNKTENNKGGNDYWIVKLDNTGNILWQKTIGGNFDDVLTSVVQTNDGGYIVGGYSYSDISGDKSEGTIGPYGYTDFWILKLDTIGNIEWQNTIGGDSYDNLITMQQCYDGGYILGGTSMSDISADKTENSFGQDDYWVVKIDAVGSIQWQTTIGGISTDFLYDLELTFDGGYILGGYSHSEISGNKTEGNIGSEDYWVIKLFPEECISPVTFYADIDGDGFGNAVDTISACIPPAGYVTNAWDCDDANISIHPGADEACNEMDDNCDFSIDEGLTVQQFYLDSDNDGFGNILFSIHTCLISPPSGYTVDSSDCNDDDHQVNPDALEVCNGIDDNCNLLIEEGLTVYTLFRDGDGDSYGNQFVDTTSCAIEIVGFVADSTDCDDTDASIYPGAEELFNALDDNCNDSIDEGLVAIENISESFFEIYPNPNSGAFVISLEYPGGSGLNLEIYNLFGSLLFSSYLFNDHELGVRLPDAFEGIAEVVLYNNRIRGSYLIYVIK